MAKKKEHKTELRKFQVVRSYCLENGCKYKGDFAVQGHCFHVLPDARSRYIATAMGHGEKLIGECKKLAKTPKDYLRRIEGLLVCTWANNHFGLDELVYLRAENASLRKAAGKPLEPRPK